MKKKNKFYVKLSEQLTGRIPGGEDDEDDDDEDDEDDED